MVFLCFYIVCDVVVGCSIIFNCYDFICCV